MIIIFLGTTGVHHSLIAAYIYLEKLKQTDFKMLPGFSDVQKDYSGFPIFIDRDSRDNRIYTLGAGKEISMAKNTIEDLVNVLGFSAKDLVVKPIRIKGEHLMRLAEKIPKFLGRQTISLLLSDYIVKKEYYQILKDVEDFRNELKTLH